MPPDMGSRVASWVVVGSRDVADLDGLVEIDAAGVARINVLGTIDVAVSKLIEADGELVWTSLPLSARGATDLDSDNMVARLQDLGWRRVAVMDRRS